MKIWVLFLVLFSTVLSADEKPNPFLDLEYYLNQIRYDQCDEFRGSSQVKIAILENSFPEFTDEDRKTLPEDMEILASEANLPNGSIHGKYVAQLVYLITTRGGRCPELAPKVYLIPASGYTKLKNAIDLAIEKDVDFILHTNVFEYHGFGDGKGFINTLVNKAIDHGITWINAAGNFNGKVYQDQISPNEDGWLKLSTEEDHIRLFCPKTEHNTKCDVRLTLQWNDFADDPITATTKDLDFAIYTDAGKRLEVSSRTQTDDPTLIEEDPLRNTRYPYEAIQLSLDPGSYEVKIKAHTKNFAANDQFRLIVNSEFAKLLSINPSTNSILPPADNPRVITVGARDAALSSMYNDGTKIKPEFVLQSSLRNPGTPLPKDTDGEFLGSSISSTIFAALSTLVKSRFPDVNEDELLNKVTERFLETTECHYTVETLDDKYYLQDIMDNNPNDVVIYPHEHGLRVLTAYDPYKVFGMPKVSNMFLGVNPKGDVVSVATRSYLSFLALDGVVIDEQSKTYKICNQ